MDLNPVFANISKTTSPTSDSFHLIMSHMKILFKAYESGMYDRIVYLEKVV